MINLSLLITIRCDICHSAGPYYRIAKKRFVAGRFETAGPHVCGPRRTQDDVSILAYVAIDRNLWSERD